MTNLRSEILNLVKNIPAYDALEEAHLSYVQEWLASGAEIFRREKPATPDPHLVCYFVLIDREKQHILLVDHKKAKLWLPSGGHVEIEEHPKETVKREIFEELFIPAQFLMEDPAFLTVTRTAPLPDGHVDISLWYVLTGDSTIPLKYDQEEFHGIQWFAVNSLPYPKTDPHMERFVRKLQQIGVL